MAVKLRFPRTNTKLDGFVNDSFELYYLRVFRRSADVLSRSNSNRPRAADTD